ncbi:MAG: BrnT family toxin [Lentisphaerae bacterium]|nr:BrnT family toxin [Lentisphaerota bacterium]
MDYDFEWDPNKARRNRRKHGVAFEQAATVFRDPRAVSVFDDAHSGKEDRWITLGLSASGGLLVVHHTFEELNAQTIRVRVFSSRKATKHEAGQYKE